MADGPQEGPNQAFDALKKLNPTAPGAAGSPAAEETTFVLLRPAAVRGGLVSEVLVRFERRGFALAAMRMVKPGAEMSEKHYRPRGASKAELAALCAEIAAGPVVAVLWQGAGAVRSAHAMVGDSDPRAAAPGTIHGDMSPADTADVLVECAADAADAARLAALWFDEADLCASAPSLVVPAAGAEAEAAGGGESARTALANKLAVGEHFYVTTAINYANGPPHMGHAYEAVSADVLARYHRAYGRKVFFCTGADEHGQKIADTAAAQSIKPIELCDKHVAQFKHLDATLKCDFDG